MIYVLAGTQSEFERWREAAGLARSNVSRITATATRMHQIATGDVVMLPGFLRLTPTSNLEDIRAMLYPCGVDWERIHEVPEGVLDPVTRQADKPELPEGVKVPEQAVEAAYLALDGEQLKWLAAAPPGRKALVTDALAAALPAILAAERERWEAELWECEDAGEAEHARAEKAKAFLKRLTAAVAETLCDDPLCPRCRNFCAALDSTKGEGGG